MTIANVIFQKTTVQKGQLYSTLKSILTSNGWTNISSNPTTDYDVFYSKGVNGKMNLYFDMCEYPYFMINPTNSASNLIANSSYQFSTTNYGYLSFRLTPEYTPAAPGTSGTFASLSGWLTHACWWYGGQNSSSAPFYSYDSMAPGTMVTLYYNCNANRLIFYTVMPIVFGMSQGGLTTGQMGGNICIIGMPDNNYGDEHDGTGVLFASTMTRGASQNPGSKNCLITQNPDNGSQNFYNMNITQELLPLSQSVSGVMQMSRCTYGTNVEGTRGVIDGIFVFGQTDNNVYAMDGDSLQDSSGNVYRYTITPQWQTYTNDVGYNNFASNSAWTSYLFLPMAIQTA